MIKEKSKFPGNLISSRFVALCLSSRQQHILRAQTAQKQIDDLILSQKEPGEKMIRQGGQYFAQYHIALGSHSTYHCYLL